MTHPFPPDRYALYELDALLDQIALLRNAGDWARFDSDDHYRWALYMLWVALGNEAVNYARAAGSTGRAGLWQDLYLLRCALAHEHLSNIDTNWLWRATAHRAEQEVRPAVRAALI